MCEGMHTQSLTSERSSRSLLLANCKQHRLVLNFDNTWTEQTLHVLNPPVNEDI